MGLVLAREMVDIAMISVAELFA